MATAVNTTALINSVLQNMPSAAEFGLTEINSDGANLPDLRNALTQYQAFYNQFANTLINEIGLRLYQHAMGNNPLAVFTDSTPLLTGAYVSMKYTDMLKTMDYDPNANSSEVYKVYQPDIQQVFHVVNFQKVVPVTINQENLVQAFVDMSSVDSFVADIVSELYESATQVYYEYSKQAIYSAAKNGNMLSVSVPDINDDAATEDTRTAFLKKTKTLSRRMTFTATNYNYAGVYNRCDMADQMWIVTPETEAALDMTLARIYNMSKAEISAKMLVVDNFNGLENQGYIGFMVSKKWLRVYKQLEKVTSQYNPLTMGLTYFLQLRAAIATNPFENAIAFVTTAAPTVESVTIAPAAVTLGKGQTELFLPTVTGTGSLTSKCTWAVTGASSSQTRITTLGFLVVGVDETSNSLTVTATSVVDTTKSGAATVTVTH